MHRNKAIELLNQYQETNVNEKKSAGEFITFIKSHQDCFERTLQIGHITGSAWLVNIDGSKVLLTLHKNLNKWMQLGGHADGEPDIKNVAFREAQEESGIIEIAPIAETIFDIDAHLIPARGEEPDHIHFDIRFAFKVIGTETFTISSESHDLSWIGIDDIEKYSKEESMLRMVRKWKLLRDRL